MVVVVVAAFLVPVNFMEEEWEVVIDDDFVYKRPKHPTISSSAAPQPLPDPAAEEKNRKERKKMTLLKLKKRYQQEICHWELLSNTLHALQNHPQNQPTTTTLLPDLPVVISTDQHSPDSVSRELADSLLLLVEAQEAFIKEISALCDVSEALCSAQEQLLNQPFLHLPVWETSPRKLITLLCDE